MPLKSRKYFRIKLSIGDCKFVLPSSWSIGVSQKVLAKLILSPIEIINYFLYYSQVNFHKKQISYSDIRDLSKEEKNNSFIGIISQDVKLLSNFSDGKTTSDIYKCVNILKRSLQYKGEKLGTMILGVSLNVAITDFWLTALKGNFSHEKEEELKHLSSSLQKISNENQDIFDLKQDHINNLVNFENYRETFVQVSKRISYIISEIRNAGLWVPRRFSKEIINEFLSFPNKKISLAEITSTIFKYFDEFLNGKFLSEWKQSPLFRDNFIVLEQAFEAHRKNLYAPSITCFLTILDFIIFEIAKIMELDTEARNTNSNVLESICSFIEKDIINATSVSDFTPKGDHITNGIEILQIVSLIAYIRDIIFGDTNNLNDISLILSRHGILHGKFFNYPSLVNSKKLILLIDELHQFYKQFPEILIDDNS